MSVDTRRPEDYLTLDDPLCDACGSTGCSGPEGKQVCGKCNGAGRVKAAKPLQPA